MGSGVYERRVCPACGCKGRLAPTTIAVGDLASISGSRCGKCHTEFSYGEIVRRGHRQPVDAEIRAARIRAIEAEIRSLESERDGIDASIIELRNCAKKLNEGEERP